MKLPKINIDFSSVKLNSIIRAMPPFGIFNAAHIDQTLNPKFNVLPNSIFGFRLSSSIPIFQKTPSFADVLKNKLCGLSFKMAHLVSSFVANLKRKKERDILKIIKRIDSISNKTTSQVSIELLRKYRILGKLSDDDIEKLLIASSKKDITALLGLIFGILSLFVGIFGLVMPKNRKRVILSIVN